MEPAPPIRPATETAAEPATETASEHPEESSQ
jgi:hypothetical protein